MTISAQTTTSPYPDKVTQSTYGETETFTYNSFGSTEDESSVYGRTEFISSGETSYSSSGVSTGYTTKSFSKTHGNRATNALYSTTSSKTVEYYSDAITTYRNEFESFYTFLANTYIGPAVTQTGSDTSDTTTTTSSTTYSTDKTNPTSSTSLTTSASYARQIKVTDTSNETGTAFFSETTSKTLTIKTGATSLNESLTVTYTETTTQTYSTLKKGSQQNSSRTYSTTSLSDLTGGLNPFVLVIYPDEGEILYSAIPHSFGATGFFTDFYSETDSLILSRDGAQTYPLVSRPANSFVTWTRSVPEGDNDSFIVADFDGDSATYTRQVITDFGELTTETFLQYKGSYSEETIARDTGVIYTNTLTSRFGGFPDYYGSTISTTSTTVLYSTRIKTILFGSLGFGGGYNEGSTSTIVVDFSYPETYSLQRNVDTAILVGNTVVSTGLSRSTVVSGTGTITEGQNIYYPSIANVSDLEGVRSKYDEMAVVPSTDMSAGFGIGLTAIPSGYEALFESPAVVDESVYFLTTVPMNNDTFRAIQDLDSVTFLSTTTTTNTDGETQSTELSKTTLLENIGTNEKTYLGDEWGNLYRGTIFRGLATVYVRGGYGVTTRNFSASSSSQEFYSGVAITVPEYNDLILEQRDIYIAQNLNQGYTLIPK